MKPNEFIIFLYSSSFE